jgi:hypothetical protein
MERTLSERADRLEGRILERELGRMEALERELTKRTERIEKRVGKGRVPPSEIRKLEVLEEELVKTADKVEEFEEFHAAMGDFGKVATEVSESDAKRYMESLGMVQKYVPGEDPLEDMVRERQKEETLRMALDNIIEEEVGELDFLPKTSNPAMKEKEASKLFDFMDLPPQSKPPKSNPKKAMEAYKSTPGSMTPEEVRRFMMSI